MVNLSSMGIYFASLVVFCIGALLALVLKNNDHWAQRFGNWSTIIGSLFGIWAGGNALTTGTVAHISLTSSLPYLAFTFTIDALSAFFIFTISLIAFFVAIYSLSYAKHYAGTYNIGALHCLTNLFIASMLLVVASGNGLFFLMSWEIMSLTSYFLVVYERNKSQNIRAGFLYFVMTHVGTAAIILAFLLLATPSGSFEFMSIKNTTQSLSPLMQGVIFVLALFGFGTKAGVIPLHIWLPSAHPAAPSHISALMSGVMIKTGIYMMIRLFVDLLQQPPLWWGITILLAGAISSLLGVLYALAEHNLKRLLAFHSIENIGIILLGLGSGLTFLALDHPSLAALGFAAALFHTLNHAVFKALLFLAAGAVIEKTHTNDIEEYGGLIKKMPRTALFFLIGSMAISALPPLNGFFSEWLTFQSLFAGIGLFRDNGWIPFIFMITAAALAFTGGLAAACFVKAFGATFLARPRSDKAAAASEVPLASQIGMGGLALLTVVLGVAAGAVAARITNITTSLIANSNTAARFYFSSVDIIANGATLSMPMVFLMLMVILGIVYGLVKMQTKNRKVTRGATWNCGSNLTPRMEITATGFARSIVIVFRGVLKPTKHETVEYESEQTRYFPRTISVHLAVIDVYKHYLYDPLTALIKKISERIKLIQSGNVNAYIVYIFVTLLVLLIVAK